MSRGANKESVAWCEERLRQPGETLHLARLFTPRASRPAATLIGALYVELESTISRPRDFNVTRMKLGWWRDELGRLADGAPAHPATRLLVGTDMSKSIHHLLDLVTGMELNMLEGAPRDAATARVRSERSGARLAAALNAQLRAGNPKADDLGNTRLGRGIALARLLRQPEHESLHAEVAEQVRADLGGPVRGRLAASAPAIRVLATLAWQQARRTQTGRPSTSRAYRMDTLRAWRAARGTLPRSMRKRQAANLRVLQRREA